MGEVDRDYELKVLEMVINTYLDEIVSVTENDLLTLLDGDRVVWELATKIYNQSGHKVEFCTVRDVVNSRSRTIKAQLEEAHCIAHEEERLDKATSTSTLRKLREDESKAKIFVKVRKILSDWLSVDENEVNLDSHIVDDLGANSSNVFITDFVIALEEELDIEITDEEAIERLNLSESSYGSSWFSVSSGIPDGSWVTTACQVKEVVDFVYEKLSS